MKELKIRTGGFTTGFFMPQNNFSFVSKNQLNWVINRIGVLNHVRSFWFWALQACYGKTQFECPSFNQVVFQEFLQWVLRYFLWFCSSFPIFYRWDSMLSLNFPIYRHPPTIYAWSYSNCDRNNHRDVDDHLSMLKKTESIIAPQ